MIVNKKIQSIMYRINYNLLRIILNNHNSLPLDMNSMIAPSATLIISKGGTIKCGKGFSLLKRASISVGSSGTLTIGEDVTIGIDSFINVHKELNIGNNVILGQGVKIYDHDHDIKNYPMEGKKWRNQFLSSPITIGNNVWIGSNVIILRGTVIGDNCVIGAGTVLKGIYESNSIIVQKKEDVIKKKVEGTVESNKDGSI